MVAGRPASERWMGSVSERCFAFGEGGHIDVTNTAHIVCQSADTRLRFPRSPHGIMDRSRLAATYIDLSEYRSGLNWSTPRGAGGGVADI